MTNLVLDGCKRFEVVYSNYCYKYIGKLEQMAASALSYQVHFINPLSAVLVTTSCRTPVSVLGVSEGALI
jgi:hypothetical protein